MEKEFYEVSVSYSSEIKAAYEYAVEHNIKYYRCLSKVGKIFGWNKDKDKYVEAEVEQEWFENPEYTELDGEEEIAEELENAPVTNEAEDIEAHDENAEESATNEDSEAVEEVPEEIDYKALYEETLDILKKTQDEAAENLKDYLSTKEELESIKNAFLTLTKEFKEAQEKLGE